MKKNVTIKDVAKQAGVSISTVSRVINDSKPVTDEVKQRVREVIKETGYVPNPLARSLVTRKSMLIGVVVPEMADPFVSEILTGIEEVAKMYDYDILLSNTYMDKDQEEKSINLLKAKQVEGIIMLTWEVSKESVDLIENSGIPAIYISKTAGEYDVNTVSTNNKEATKEMTDYLVKTGHSRIGFVMTSNDYTVLEHERLTGYKEALEVNGIDFDDSLVSSGSTDYESGYRAAMELLGKIDKPDALFVTGDEAAIGAVNACFDSGLRVPEDISVAGFNDIRYAKMFRPSLTTVHQPLYDIGAVAVRMIIKIINGERDFEKRVKLPHEIIERNSVIKR